ncbi:hypothetical protein N2152v2_001156 [Parachlorella kessleri]
MAAQLAALQEEAERKVAQLMAGTSPDSTAGRAVPSAAPRERGLHPVTDAVKAKALSDRVGELEEELRRASGLAAGLTQQLQQAQQATQAAERAQRAAEAAAALAQREAQALAQQLASQSGESPHAPSEGQAQGQGKLHAELAEARQQAAHLQAALQDLRQEIAAAQSAVGRGGREAAAHRQRAQKLQSQVTRLRVSAEAAAQRAAELEGTLATSGAVLVAGAATPAQAMPASGRAVGQGKALHSAVALRAHERLERLEQGVNHALRNCDTATAALAAAVRGQHQAEQTQAAVEQQLLRQAARVAALEASLAEHVSLAAAAARRGELLHEQLAQQADRAAQAEQHAQQLDVELVQRTGQVTALSGHLAELEGRVRERSAAAGEAEACVQRLQTEVACERRQADELARRAQDAEQELEQCKAQRKKEQLEEARAALALRAELRAKLLVRKIRSKQLASEVTALRRAQGFAEHDATKLAMQAQRAQQAADRSSAQLAATKEQLSAAQGQLGRASQEVEHLRACDRRKQAQLAEAGEFTQALTAEVDRLAAALAKRDSLVQHWRQQAELAKQHLQAAGGPQGRRLGMAEDGKGKLLEKHNNREQEGGPGEEAALHEKLRQSQAEARGVRAELAEALAQLADVEKHQEELQEQGAAERAAYRELLEQAQVAAQRTARQCLSLSQGQEALASTALGTTSSWTYLAWDHGQQQQQAGQEREPTAARDFIAEEDARGLLAELDAGRAHLRAAVLAAEEGTRRAQAAEARAAQLQARLGEAAGRAADAEGRAGVLQARVGQLVAAQQGMTCGAGKRMQALMQELAEAREGRRAAEAAAAKLSAEKSALLKDLAFGITVAGRGPGGRSPFGSKTTIKPWRLPTRK